MEGISESLVGEDSNGEFMIEFFLIFFLMAILGELGKKSFQWGMGINFEAKIHLLTWGLQVNFKILEIFSLVI